MSEYIPKGKPTTIKFCSRASVKIKDNFYTFEYGEERQIDYDNCNYDLEIKSLCNDCNKVIDDQIEEVFNSLVRKN